MKIDVGDLICIKYLNDKYCGGFGDGASMQGIVEDINVDCDGIVRYCGTWGGLYVAEEYGDEIVVLRKANGRLCE